MRLTNMRTISTLRVIGIAAWILLMMPSQAACCRDASLATFQRRAYPATRTVTIERCREQPCVRIGERYLGPANTEAVIYNMLTLQEFIDELLANPTFVVSTQKDD